MCRLNRVYSLKIFFLFLLLFFLVFSFPVTTEFPASSQPDYQMQTSSQPDGAALGDLDKDGDMDLAIGNDELPIDIFYQAGGVFPATPSKILNSPNGATELAIADMNNDGRNDLVSINTDPPEQGVHIYSQDIHGSLPVNASLWLKTGSPGGGFPVSLGIGDFDNDGLKDIVIGVLEEVSQNDTVKIYYQPFFNEQIYDTKIDLHNKDGAEDLAVGDFDNNGKDDIAVINYNSNTAFIFYHGTEGFGNYINQTINTDMHPHEIISGDIDSDGDDDIAVLHTAPTAVAIYLQNGAIPVNPSMRFNVSSFSLAFALGYFNFDDLLDFVAAAAVNSEVHLQRQDRTFSSTPDFYLSNTSAPMSVVAGDVDNDAYDDIVIINFFGLSNVYLHEMPDYDVQIDGIVPQSYNPNKATTINVIAGVRNLGNLAVNNVTVKFFVDNVYKANATIQSLASREKKNITFTWKAQPEGEHYLKVNITPVSNESYKANNVYETGITVVAPDLYPSNMQIIGQGDGTAVVSALVNNKWFDNDLIGPASDIKVRFYSQNPYGNPDHASQIGGEQTITVLDKHQTIRASVVWNAPAAGANVHVWTDPYNRIAERVNETSNTANFTLPSHPEVTNVYPTFLGHKVEEHVTILANKATIAKFIAETSHTFRINRTVFNLTGAGSCNAVVTDYDGGDGWNYTRNFENCPDGEYTVTAQAVDEFSLVSPALSYYFNVLSLPSWLGEFTIEINGSPVSIEFNIPELKLCYKFEYDDFEFFKKDDKGGKDNDPLTGNKKSGAEAEASIEVSFCSDDTGSFEGKVGGKSDTLGKAPAFIEEAGASVTVSGDITSQFGLEDGRIQADLYVILSHLYGIKIPYINMDAGIKISGEPHFKPGYSFSTDENRNFVAGPLYMTVTVRIKGGLVIGTMEAWGAGAEVYGYAEPEFTGQNIDPNLKIKVGVGAGGKINAWGWQPGWEGEAYKWTWPSSRIVMKNFTFDFSGLAPENGSLMQINPNAIVNDLDYDNSPYVAYDNTNTPMAVWTGNYTVPDEADIFYSRYISDNWTAQQKITNTSYPEATPVLTFDPNNNNGIAVWTQISRNLTRNNTFDELIDSFSGMDLYYSIYNGANWASPVALTSDNFSDFTPAIASDSFSGNTVVVWVRDNDANYSTTSDRNLYYSVWNNAFWTIPAPVAPAFGNDFNPAAAFNSTGGIIIVWVHDENDTASIADDDTPPQIRELGATQEEIIVPGTAVIQAKVSDNTMETTVAGNLTYPNGTKQQTALAYNATSGFYETSVSISQQGVYTINLTAADLLGQTHSASAQFKGFQSSVQDIPAVQNPTTDRRVYHTNNIVTVTASVNDTDVASVIARISGPVNANITLQNTGGNMYKGNFTDTASAGRYTIVINATDNQSNSFIGATKFDIANPSNNEIYYAVGTPIAAGFAFSPPVLVTDRNDYETDDHPGVAFDINDNAAVVWEERGSISKIMSSYYIPENPFSDCRRVEQATNLAFNNFEPKIKRTNTDYLMMVWRADSEYGDWSDVYYSVINSTQAVYSGPGGMYCAPVWSPPTPLSMNNYPDWKPSVAVDQYSNNVMAAWQGHHEYVFVNPETNEFEFVADDDDVYYETFEFPIQPPENIPVQRFKDGTKQKMLDFSSVNNHTIEINIPEFAFTDWDARMQLEGFPDDFGMYPENVSIDIGDDGTTDFTFSQLKGEKTFYFNADMYAALEQYLRSFWFIEAQDGTADGKVTVPVTISSDTEGIVVVDGINIGYSFVNHQRPPPLGDNCNDPPNLTPILNAIDNITVDEADIIEIVANATDIDRDDIIYLISDPRFEQVYNIFRWKTEDGDAGIYNLEMLAWDCSNITEGINTKTFRIEVQDDNKAPVINNITNVMVNQGELAEIIVFANDVNNDPLAFSVNDSKFVQDGNTFTWQADEIGSFDILFTATDGIYNDTEQVNIIVEPAGGYLFLDELADGSKSKNITFSGPGTLTEYLLLPKNADVLLAKMDLTGFASGSQGNILFSDNFDDGDISDWTTIVQGSGVISTSSDRFTSPPFSLYMNSPTGTPSQAMAFSRNISINFSKPYNVSLYFQITSASSHFITVFKNNNSQLHVDTPSKDLICRDTSNHFIQYLNSNQWYNISTEFFPLIRKYDVYVDGIFKRACDYSPESVTFGRFFVGDFESGTANYGEAYWDDIMILQNTTALTHPLNPSLDVGNDSDIQWQYNGTLNMRVTTPDFSQELNEYLTSCTPVNGNCLVPLVFSSDSAGIIEISNINITYLLPNNPPELEPIGNKMINENQLLAIDVNASDLDNDTLTYFTNAAEVLPSYFTFNESTGLFIWTPTYFDSGEYIVTFNVTDGELWDAETITITVVDVPLDVELKNPYVSTLSNFTLGGKIYVEFDAVNNVNTTLYNISLKLETNSTDPDIEFFIPLMSPYQEINFILYWNYSQTGTYEPFAFIDYTMQLPEYNENNNIVGFGIMNINAPLPLTGVKKGPVNKI